MTSKIAISVWKVALIGLYGYSYRYYKMRLNATPEITAKVTRTAITLTAEIPIFLVNTVSTGKLWENVSIIAKMDISLIGSERGAIAPIAAYMPKILPI